MIGDKEYVITNDHECRILGIWGQWNKHPIQKLRTLFHLIFWRRLRFFVQKYQNINPYQFSYVIIFQYLPNFLKSPGKKSRVFCGCLSTYSESWDNQLSENIYHDPCFFSKPKVGSRALCIWSKVIGFTEI